MPDTTWDNSYLGLRVYEDPAMPAGTFRVLPALNWNLISIDQLPEADQRCYRIAGGEIKTPVVIVHSMDDARRTINAVSESRRG